MEKKMETTTMGYIGTTIRILFIPSFLANQRPAGAQEALVLSHARTTALSNLRQRSAPPCPSTALLCEPLSFNLGWIDPGLGP